MYKRSAVLSISLLILFATLLIAACSGDKSKPADDHAAVDSVYGNWQTFTYSGIRIHHAPHHFRDTLFHEDAQYWDAIRRRQAKFLNIPVPPDTIDVMYFTGPGRGKAVTGREYPFVRHDTIFFWQPSFYGPVMARYMINKWHPGPTNFPFLREGIIALLDFSGQNYHELTLRNIDEDRFEPLAELAVDTAVNSDVERRKTTEAASFVDFIVFHYGTKALDAMYGADGSFDAVVKGLFMISVDSLQTLWLETARRGAALDTAGTKQ